MPRVIPPACYETIQVTGNILDILLTEKGATHCIVHIDLQIAMTGIIFRIGSFQLKFLS